jgi:hypothetical protein
MENEEELFKTQFLQYMNYQMAKVSSNFNSKEENKSQINKNNNLDIDSDSSSDEEDENIKPGFHKLNSKKKEKIKNFLLYDINTSR